MARAIVTEFNDAIIINVLSILSWSAFALNFSKCVHAVVRWRPFTIEWWPVPVWMFSFHLRVAECDDRASKSASWSRQHPKSWLHLVHTKAEPAPDIHMLLASKQFCSDIKGNKMGRIAAWARQPWTSCKRDTILEKGFLLKTAMKCKRTFWCKYCASRRTLTWPPFCDCDGCES